MIAAITPTVTTAAAATTTITGLETLVMAAIN